MFNEFLKWVSKHERQMDRVIVNAGAMLLAATLVLGVCNAFH